jgi:ABC-type antimicrobial peptide transport system permease subunit
MEQLHSRVAKRTKQLRADYVKEKQQLTAAGEDMDYNDYNKADELLREYLQKVKQVEEDCRQELILEGAYTTYTIEGIVDGDVNRMEDGIAFLLPLKQYYALTGTDASMSTGIQYHFSRVPVSKLEAILEMDIYTLMNHEEDYTISPYLYISQMLLQMKYAVVGVIAVIIFVTLMSSLNIINTTAGNLHLRRKEFAQLRVLGVSQKRLMKMVMLEGVISSIVANLLGIVMAVLLMKVFLEQILYLMLATTFPVPYKAAAIAVVGSTLILCGSVYLPIRNMNQDLAVDLAEGADL